MQCVSTSKHHKVSGAEIERANGPAFIKHPLNVVEPHTPGISISGLGHILEHAATLWGLKQHCYR